MARSGPGDAVSTNPRDVWYAWRTAMAKRGDPGGDDPLTCYEFGVRIGQRMCLERTAKWAGLVPLLQDVQHYLVELAVERLARALEEEIADVGSTDLGGDRHGLGPAERD